MSLKFETNRYLRFVRLVVASALTGVLFVTLGLLLATPGEIQAQEPYPFVINEFMSSNGQIIADEDGDYEDWIEIYNTGALTVSLNGYGLSDDPAEPFRWVFPDVELSPGAHLLVWASGKDRDTPGQPLHTSFSIKASGEALLLTHPTSVTVDQVEPIDLFYNIAYGRKPDGEDAWFFFDQPTPGSSNTTPGYTALLEPPTFSQTGGFFTEAFSLTLSHAVTDVEVIFTLDGSLPDPANLNGHTYTYKNQYPKDPGDPFGTFLTDSYRTYAYTQPLAIVNRITAPDKLTGKSSTYDLNPDYFPTEPVLKSTVVRARAVMSGALPSAVRTHTFFVTPQGRDRYTLPVIALSMDEDTLFDYNTGIYNAGIDFDTWRTEHPSTPASGASDANWQRNTEFAAHLDLFETDSPAVAFSQDMGFRLHGDYSLVRRMKSLRLYARSDYGESEFEYPLFPDLPYDNYKRVLLRNSGNDFNYTMFRDAAIQTSVAHLNIDTQAYRPAVVFFNGEYWGIHNLRERYDKYYLEQVYDVDPDNIDLLENNANPDEGDDDHYLAMLDYIDTNGLVDPEHYEYIQTQMDVENYIDYQIVEIFIDNTDWPQNNIKYWRSKTAYDPEAPYGQDGRWRWLLYDTDPGLGMWGHSVTEDTLSRVSADGEWYTFLFSELLTNETFKEDFISRFADLLNTTFLPERMESHIQTLKAAIEPEMPEDIARWKDPDSMSYWNTQVNVMINYANGRPAPQRQHITNKFGLSGTFTLTVDVSDPAHGYVRVNTIELLESTPGVATDPYPWDGIYFQGVPVELEAIPASGYQFASWQEVPTATAVLSFTEESTTTVTLTALFEPLSNTPPTVTTPITLQELIVDGETPMIDLETAFEDADGDPLTFAAMSGDTGVVQLSSNANLITLTGALQGGTVITVSADDGYYDPVTTTFRALVYPQAYPLSDSSYTFDAWDPELPEGTYPDFMLFLQSDTDDTLIDTPLLYAYFIPHDDYNSDDDDVIGFPYTTTKRTRLNGLGEDGISFINTGRERDLGAALMALDTQSVGDPVVSWLGGTLLQNSRVYALRLQYRVGIEDPFTDVLVDGQPVEYLTNVDDHQQTFDKISLPTEALDQPYVQLLWRYYLVSGDDGKRAQLRLDDIVVADRQTVTLSGPFGTGTFYPFEGGIDCGGVTFTSTGTLNNIQITLTHKYPTANQDGLPRYYEITADGSGFEAQLQLCYTDDDVSAAGLLPTDEENLRALRWNGNAWDMFPGEANSGGNLITAENVIQFSTWGIGTSANQPTAVTLYRVGSTLAPYFGMLAAGIAIAGWRIRRRREDRLANNS